MIETFDVLILAGSLFYGILMTMLFVQIGQATRDIMKFLKD